MSWHVTTILIIVTFSSGELLHTQHFSRVRRQTSTVRPVNKHAHQCIFKDSNGAVYDLSALANKDWTATSDAMEDSAILRVCDIAAIAPPQCSPDLASSSAGFLVQDSACVPLGDTSKLRWQPLESSQSSKGIVLTYGGSSSSCVEDPRGDVGKIRWELRYIFVCAEEYVEAGPLAVVPDKGACVMTAYWPSQSGCPKLSMSMKMQGMFQRPKGQEGQYTSFDMVTDAIIFIAFLSATLFLVTVFLRWQKGLPLMESTEVCHITGDVPSPTHSNMAADHQTGQTSHHFDSRVYVRATESFEHQTCEDDPLDSCDSRFNSHEEERAALI